MSSQCVQDAVIAGLPHVTNLSDRLTVRTVTIDGENSKYNAFNLPDGPVNTRRIHEKN